METICCAAIKRTDGIILAGRNHAFVIQYSPKGTCKQNSQQGFITSEARFVGRSEAAEIAYKAKQIKKPTNVLFSEDITQDNSWAGEIIEQLQAEIEDLKSGHFCPSPQLAKEATICNCAHSDRHRAMDWEKIKQLQAALEKYGEHLPGCEFAWKTDGPRKCSCGFE